MRNGPAWSASSLAWPGLTPAGSSKVQITRPPPPWAFAVASSQVRPSCLSRSLTSSIGLGAGSVYSQWLHPGTAEQLWVSWQPLTKARPVTVVVASRTSTSGWGTSRKGAAQDADAGGCGNGATARPSSIVTSRIQERFTRNGRARCTIGSLRGPCFVHRMPERQVRDWAFLT